MPFRTIVRHSRRPARSRRVVLNTSTRYLARGARHLVERASKSPCAPVNPGRKGRQGAYGGIELCVVAAINLCLLPPIR